MRTSLSKASLFLLFLLLCIAVPGSAERIRGSVAEVYTLDTGGETEGKLKVHRIVGLEIENDDFLKGFEIRIDVPRAAMEFRESFLLKIFPFRRCGVLW